MLAECLETVAPGMRVRAVQQPSSTRDGSSSRHTNAADHGSWTVLDMDMNTEELVINGVDDCSTLLDGLAPPLRGLLMTSADSLEGRLQAPKSRLPGQHHTLSVTAGKFCVEALPEYAISRILRAAPSGWGNGMEIHTRDETEPSGERSNTSVHSGRTECISDLRRGKEHVLLSKPTADPCPLEICASNAGATPLNTRQ